jgi:hypothetical protein
MPSLRGDRDGASPPSDDLVNDEPTECIISSEMKTIDCRQLVRELKASLARHPQPLTPDRNNALIASGAVV